MTMNPLHSISLLGFVIGACATSPSGLVVQAQPTPVTTIVYADPTEYDDSSPLELEEIDVRTLVCGVKRFYVSPSGRLEVLDVGANTSRVVTCYATTTVGDTESAKSNLIRVQCINNKCFKREQGRGK